MYTAKETTMNYLQARKREITEKMERQMKANINTFHIMQQLVAIDITIEIVEESE